MSDELLTKLLTYRLFEYSESGYQNLGVTVRKFAEAEQFHGGGFVRFNHEMRTFEIILNDESLGGCPVARYLVGLHESGHVVNHDNRIGGNTKKFGVTVAEQEAEAWRFVGEVVRANYSTVEPATRIGYLDYCLKSCVGLKDEPKRCTQPSMANLLEEIGSGGNRGKATAKALSEELVKAIQVNKNGWFSKSARGLKDEGGNPLLPKSKATRRGSKAVGVKPPKNPKGKLLPKFTEGIRRVHIVEDHTGRFVGRDRKPRVDHNGKGKKVRIIDGVPHVLTWVYTDTGEPVNRRPLKG